MVFFSVLAQPCPLLCLPKIGIFLGSGARHSPLRPPFPAADNARPHRLLLVLFSQLASGGNTAFVHFSPLCPHPHPCPCWYNSRFWPRRKHPVLLSPCPLHSPNPSLKLVHFSQLARGGRTVPAPFPHCTRPCKAPLVLVQFSLLHGRQTSFAPLSSPTGQAKPPPFPPFPRWYNSRF